MKAARLYGVLALLLVAAPAVAEELPGGWVTGTLVARLAGAPPQAGTIAEPGANCSTLGHRAAVEVDSSRNGDLEVLFGLRGGTQYRMYDNPASCNGDDLDVIFRNNSGPSNVCNPVLGAQISPVQSLSLSTGSWWPGTPTT